MGSDAEAWKMSRVSNKILVEKSKSKTNLGRHRSRCYDIEIYLNTYVTGSRDSVIAIATGYGMEDRWIGVRVPVG